MAFASTSRVRACAVRSSVLSLLKANSISLKSGESGGSYNSCAPYFLIISANPSNLCTAKLSGTVTLPGRRVGFSTWSG